MAAPIIPKRGKPNKPFIKIALPKIFNVFIIIATKVTYFINL